MGAPDVIRHPLLAPLAALLLFAVAGCSGPLDRPLAQVGDRTVTVDDFIRIARGNEQQYPGDAAAAKDSLLRDLMVREAMLIAARERGYDQHPQAVTYRLSLEEQAMQRELRDMFAPPGVGVSEAELREMYRWRGEQAHLQIVYTFDEASARIAANQLAAGDPFEQVADRWNFPGMIGPGGDAGWASPGQLMQPLDDAIRKMPLGFIGGPYRTAQGWFLVRVLERRPQEQMPFELQRANLEQMVRQRKQREVFTREVESIKREYDMKPVFAATQRVYQILQDGVPPAAGNEENEVLVRWRGGQYTVADLMQDLNDPNAEKPPASMMPAIEVWLETRALSRVLGAEARRRHLDQSPRVLKDVRDQFDNYLTQGLYVDVTSGAGAPDDADLRAVWERVRPQFVKLEWVDLEWIDLADSAQAMNIARHGGSGVSLADAIAMQAPSLSAHAERITFPASDNQWSVLEPMFIRIEPGTWVGPERRADGWRLLRMAGKQQVAQELDQLPPPVLENLRRSAEELRRDRVFVAFADSVQQAVGVKRFPERLAKLAWPIPPELLPGR